MLLQRTVTQERAVEHFYQELAQVRDPLLSFSYATCTLPVISTTLLFNIITSFELCSIFCIYSDFYLDRKSI